MNPDGYADVVAWDVRAAMLALASSGVTVRVEPVSPPGTPNVVRWRVARQAGNAVGQQVLTIVPEIEGRIVCTTRSSDA